MLKRITLITIALVIAAGSALALADGPWGRDILKKGTVVNLEGTLRYEDPEWKLETGSGSYLLHFGNRAYLSETGIKLNEGEPVSVEGALSGDDLVVFSARVGGKTYRFRDENGVPLWVRRGNKTNCGDRSYEQRNRRDCEDCPGRSFGLKKDRRADQHS